jgi:hypothetical protein
MVVFSWLIRIQFHEDNKEHEDIVRGVRLDWGSSGSRTTVTGTGSSSMDGEYGVGAVSCLAAAKGAGYRNTDLFQRRVQLQTKM